MSRLHRPEAPTARTSSGFWKIKKRGEQNGIPDCNWSRGDDGSVRCDHRRLFETGGVVISRCQRLCLAAQRIIIRRYLRAKFGWRLAENAFEHFVKACGIPIVPLLHSVFALYCSNPGLDKFVFLFAYHQHRARRRADHTLRGAPDREMLPARVAVRRDYDQIDIEFFRGFHDLVSG